MSDNFKWTLLLLAVAGSLLLVGYCNGTTNASEAEEDRVTQTLLQQHHAAQRLIAEHVDSAERAMQQRIYHERRATARLAARDTVIHWDTVTVETVVGDTAAAQSLIQDRRTLDLANDELQQALAAEIRNSAELTVALGLCQHDDSTMTDRVRFYERQSNPKWFFGLLPKPSRGFVFVVGAIAGAVASQVVAR